MARKSVREMNYFERLHYSLSAKMWHAIIRFSVILALTAFVFGLLFYSHQLREQYSNKASVLAGSIELVVDPDIMDRIAKAAVEVYNGLPENVRNDPSSQAYQYAFASLMDIRYKKIEEILDEFRQQDNARYIIIGTMVDQDHFMYLFESNETEKHPLGHIEIVDQKTISAFEKIGSLMPVIFNRDDSGYSCTGAGTIVKNGRDIASIVTAYSLNDVAYKVRAYLLQFFIIMTVLTILSDIYFVRKMKRTVVTPIIELNEAARLHMQEKSEEFRTLHFSNLNIRTGDEIESLALIMADMEKEIQEYVKDLTRITAERAAVPDLRIVRGIPRIRKKTRSPVRKRVHPVRKVRHHFTVCDRVLRGRAAGLCDLPVQLTERGDLFARFFITGARGPFIFLSGLVVFLQDLFKLPVGKRHGHSLLSGMPFFCRSISIASISSKL